MKLKKNTSNLNLKQETKETKPTYMYVNSYVNKNDKELEILP